MALALEIGGVDRIAYLERDTLDIEQDVTSYVATAEFSLVDAAGALSIASKASIHIYDGATTYFHGSVAGVRCVNFTSRNLTARRFTVRCQDDHLELEKRIVDYATFAAGEYSDIAIVDALFDAYYDSGIDYTTYPTGTPLIAEMEELTLQGVTLRQALSEICRHTGGQFYVHYASSTLYFHYFSSETNAAAFSLSDNYDGESSFGYEQIDEEIDNTQLANAFYIVGKDVAGWETDPDSITAYGRHEAAINDPALLTEGAIDDRGAALLARYKDPCAQYRVVTDHGTGLRAGMQITLVWSTRSIDTSFNINRIRLYLRNDTPMFELKLGSVLPDFASQGRNAYDSDQREGSRIVQIEEEVFDTVAPGAPTFTEGNLATGVHIEPDGTQNVYITMTWGSVGDADLDHYEAQLSTASDFSANIYTRYEPGTGDRLCLWEFLQGNVTYYARVRSVDWARNASAWSDTQNITSSTDSTAPNDPTSVTATATPNSVHLSWDANSESDLAGYDVQRKPDGGEYATIAALHQSTLLIDTNVTAGQAYWYQVRATDTSGNSSSYAEIGSSVTPAVLPTGFAPPNLQGWSHELVFSASDSDTVAWAGGDLDLADGTTYTIEAGNTGNMEAVTYIYLDTDESSTVLQASTTASDSVGPNKILVAVAQNESGGKNALFQVFGGNATSGILVTADVIAANTVTANEIAGNTITASEIAGGTITADEIAANTITAAEMQAGAIGTTELAADAVTADKIDANAVVTEGLNAGAVTTVKLDAGAVTVAKLDVVVGGYNLLINSGINDDDDDDGVPDEWAETTNVTNHTNALETGQKVVGTSSFVVVISAGDTNGDEYYIYQYITLADVPLAVGDDYVLSGYIKAYDLSNLTVKLWIRWEDAEYDPVASHYAATVTEDQDWTRHTYTDTVPVGAVYGRILCYALLSADNGTGTFLFDAIKLERGDVPTTWTTGMIGNVVIDSNRVQVVDSDAKVWIGKRGASLGMWGEDAEGALQVGWYASGDNAGGILAGAGAIILSADGLIVAPYEGTAPDSVHAISLDRSGTCYGLIGDYFQENAQKWHILEMRAKAVAAKKTYVRMVAEKTADYDCIASMSVPAVTVGAISPGDGSTAYAYVENGDLRVEHGLYVGSLANNPPADDIIADGGIYLGRNADPGAGNVKYTGTLSSYKNSTEYDVSGFKYLTAPLTSTSWDGDSYSTTAKTKIDLSAVFSAPAGVKAVLAYVTVRDSDSANGDYWLILSPNDTAGQGFSCKATHAANDSLHSYSCIIPCDASGDIYYQINAHDTETLDAWIEIWGYAI